MTLVTPSACFVGVQDSAWGVERANIWTHWSPNRVIAWGKVGAHEVSAPLARGGVQHTRLVVREQDELKQQAAWRAVEYVKSGMVIGLGTGSTAAFAVDRIGQLLKEDALRDIVAVPTSVRTYEQAKGAHSDAANTGCRQR